MPEKNIPLLRKVYHFLEKHPEKHDQATWCGTQQCVAGWACHFAGWRPTQDAALVAEAAEEGFPEDFVTDGSVVANVEIVARNILGLDRYEATRLFYAGYCASALGYLRELAEL
jgi:hypothetical protein